MRVEIGLRFRCFFSRTFLTAERSVARTVVLVSPGCAAERAKSRPVSLQKGWKSAVVGGGDFSEDLTDGRGIAFEVVATRGLGQGGMLQRHAWPHA